MCFLRTEKPCICSGHWCLNPLTSAEQGAEPTAHSAPVRSQRKPLDCAVFCKGGTTGFSSTAIALPTTPQNSKRTVNVFSMALYQAYVINYSPMLIISQVIATLFCPANCRKGGKGEGGRWGETSISTKLDFACDRKCLFSWK